MRKEPPMAVAPSTGEMLEAHGFVVLYAETEHKYGPPAWNSRGEQVGRGYMRTERKKPHVPFWLHELLTRAASVLLHNTAANHGARNVWLEWVAEHQKGLSAAYRVGGSRAMWAVYDASYLRQRPVNAVRFVRKERKA